MMSQKFTIEHSAVWRRPDQAWFDFQEAAKGIEPEQLAWNGKYKALGELRDIAIFGACIYELSGEPTYVQMNTKSLSPDAFLMQKDTKSELSSNIAPVEITFYGRSKIGLPQESLVDRLGKPGGKFMEKLPSKYWLLVHIGVGLEPDHLAVADKLHEIDAQFGVFSIQQISSHPNTILKFVVYNPECKTINVNLGEVFDKLSKSNIIGTATQVKAFPPGYKKGSNE